MVALIYWMYECSISISYYVISFPGKTFWICLVPFAWIFSSFLLLYLVTLQEHLKDSNARKAFPWKCHAGHIPFFFFVLLLLQGIQTHVPTHALNARNQLTTKSISSHWQPIELFNNALYFSFLSYHKNAIHFVLYPLFVQWTFSWLFYIYELGSGSL